MSLRESLKFILVWFITITIFVFLLSKIEFTEVLRSVKEMDINMFVMAVILSFVAQMFFSVGKYREILRILGCRISFLETAVLRIGSLPLKGIFPLKIGELSRVAYLKSVNNLSYARGIGSVLISYCMSVFSLLVFILTGCLLSRFDLAGILYVAILFLSVSLVLVFFLKKTDVSLSIFTLKRIGTILTLSLGFEGCKLLNTLLLFRSFGIDVSYGYFLIFASLTILIASLPITLWGLGIRASAVLYFFSGYASSAHLLGASILISFVNRIFPIILGLLFIIPFLDKLLIHRGRKDNYVDNKAI